MILIVCGSDKSGKSSLIKKLKSDVFKNAIVFKLSEGNKPTGRAYPEVEAARVYTAYSELFAQAKKLSDDGHVVIFDRAYPSQMVYCIKRQGYTGWTDALNDEIWLTFDRWVAGLGTKMIYCWAPDHIIAERFKTEKEEYMRTDEIEAIKGRYMQFLERSKVKALLMNSTEDMDLNIEDVKKFVSLK
mgnify:CR=1 FL=1